METQTLSREDLGIVTVAPATGGRQSWGIFHGWWQRLPRCYLFLAVDSRWGILPLCVSGIGVFIDAGETNFTGLS